MRRGIPGALEMWTKAACKALAGSAKTTWLSNDRIRGIMLDAARKGINEGLRAKNEEDL
jgi:hypothetical protein